MGEVTEWVVDGHSELGVFDAEGAAMASAWGVTEAGGKRPEVLEKVKEKVNPAYPETELAWGTVRKYVAESIGASHLVERALGFTVKAWVATGPDRGLAGPWMGDEPWPRVGSTGEVKVVAEIPVTGEFRELKPASDEYAAIKRTMDAALLKTAKDHGVTLQGENTWAHKHVYLSGGGYAYRVIAHGTH